jgi:hypothetical protein
MKTLVFTLIVLLAAVGHGVAQTNIPVPAVGSTPTNLARLIVSTDHIINLGLLSHISTTQLKIVCQKINSPIGLPIATIWKTEDLRLSVPREF